jgi:hypothetical protein
MSTALDLLSSALLVCFVLTCVFSGVLQVFAWSRHAREAPSSLRTFLRPEGCMDETGQRQMRVARALLAVGVVSYLSYGVLMVVSTALR